MQFLRLSLCCKWVEQSTQTKENTQIFGRKHLAHPIYATVGNLARNRTSQTVLHEWSTWLPRVTSVIYQHILQGAAQPELQRGECCKFDQIVMRGWATYQSTSSMDLILRKEYAMPRFSEYYCWKNFATIGLLPSHQNLVIYFKEDNWFLDWTVGQIFLWKRKGRWWCLGLPLTAFSRILLERFCREENIKDLCQSPMSSWFDFHKLLQS